MSRSSPSLLDPTDQVLLVPLLSLSCVFDPSLPDNVADSIGWRSATPGASRSDQPAQHCCRHIALVNAVTRLARHPGWVGVWVEVSGEACCTRLI
ncbi:hypothetical protein NL676_036900 [Syzygium grande]|nr:hypothetical protein NL676_036900 [Syzygium grande]